MSSSGTGGGRTGLRGIFGTGVDTARPQKHEKSRSLVVDLGLKDILGLSPAERAASGGAAHSPVAPDASPKPVIVPPEKMQPAATIPDASPRPETVRAEPPERSDYRDYAPPKPGAGSKAPFTGRLDLVSKPVDARPDLNLAGLLSQASPAGSGPALAESMRVVASNAAAVPQVSDELAELAHRGAFRELLTACEGRFQSEPESPRVKLWWSLAHMRLGSLPASVLLAPVESASRAAAQTIRAGGATRSGAVPNSADDADTARLALQLLTELEVSTELRTSAFAQEGIALIKDELAALGFGTGRSSPAPQPATVASVVSDASSARPQAVPARSAAPELKPLPIWDAAAAGNASAGSAPRNGVGTKLVRAGIVGALVVLLLLVGWIGYETWRWHAFELGSVSLAKEIDSRAISPRFDLGKPRLAEPEIDRQTNANELTAILQEMRGTRRAAPQAGDAAAPVAVKAGDAAGDDSARLSTDPAVKGNGKQEEPALDSPRGETLAGKIVVDTTFPREPGNIALRGPVRDDRSAGPGAGRQRVGDNLDFPPYRPQRRADDVPFTSRSDGSRADPADSGSQVYVVIFQTRVYEAPDTRARVVDTLLAGDRVLVTSNNGRWLMLRSKRGNGGYIPVDDAQMAGDTRDSSGY